MGMTVIESGPASIYDPGTAFNIPLMDSGSVYDGYWGFVRTGIWKITEDLTKINQDLGVKFYLESNIQESQQLSYDRSTLAKLDAFGDRDAYRGTLPEYKFGAEPKAVDNDDDDDD